MKNSLNTSNEHLAKEAVLALMKLIHDGGIDEDLIFEARLAASKFFTSIGEDFMQHCKLIEDLYERHN